MKRRIFLVMICVLLLSAMLLSCSSQLKEGTEETRTRAPEETATESQEEPTETTEGKKTEGDTKNENETEKTPMGAGFDPSSDQETNILFIGDSSSYYWVDELWGLLDAAGYKNLTVCNLYHSGCKLQQHWNWLRGGDKEYTFYIHTEKGRTGVNQANMEYAMRYKKWDQITLLQTTGMYWKIGEEAYREQTFTYLPGVYDYVHKNHPNAQYYWQCGWSRELGKDVYTVEEQISSTAALRKIAEEVCADSRYDFVTYAPLGDAWNAVRHDPDIKPIIYEGGKNMTTRIFQGKANYDDRGHDGDVGGGQYLNACVWFETLTGQSCLGNTFRPKYVFEGKDYSLTEEKITLLQNAAHKTVAEKGNK